MRLSSFSILLLATAVCFAGSYGDVSKGVKAYESGDYQEALEKFKKANLIEPESPVIRHNVGRSLYKLKDFERVQEELEKAFTSAEDPKEKAKIQYDLGNAFFQADSLPRAIIHYQKSLELDPANEDAKYNLELARAILKEFADKEQQQCQQDQQQQSQQEQSQQDQQKSEQEQQEGQDRQEQNQEEQDQQDSEEEQESEGQQPQPQPGEMSEEEAERMLDAMKDSEEDLQQEKMRRQGGDGRRSQKPW